MVYFFLLHFLLSLFPTAFIDMGKGMDFFLIAPRCWRKVFCPVTTLGSKGCGMRDGVVRDSHWWGGGYGPRSSSSSGWAVPTDGLGHCLRTSGLLLWIPSMKRHGFILEATDIPLSSRKSYSRCSFLWNTSGSWARASSAQALGCLWPGGQMQMGTNQAQFY